MDEKLEKDARHEDIEAQEDASTRLAEQKRRDVLLEQERIRRWIEEDEPMPVKMACKLSQHIVAKTDEKE